MVPAIPVVEVLTLVDARLVIEALFIWLGFAIVVGVAAKARGRPGGDWFVLAVIISPLLAGLMLLALRQASDAVLAPKTKVCPFCAEQIQSAAILCRYCGRDLDIASPRTSAFELPSRPQSERGAIATGDGSYRFKVVGEADYQDDLEAIVGGRRSEGSEHECVAVLLPEPSNPHDPDAVYVFIAGHKVGYVPRNYAVAFKRALHGGGYALCACYARIVGGWDRGEHDRGDFGVELDIVFPLSIQPAAITASTRSHTLSSDVERGRGIASDTHGNGASAPERTTHTNIRQKHIVHRTVVEFGSAAASAGLAVAAAFTVWLAATSWTATPQSPSISDAGPRVPSTSGATAQSASISEAIPGVPFISEATVRLPSVSDATPRALSTSEDSDGQQVDVVLGSPLVFTVPIPRPAPGNVPMPRSRPQQDF